MLAHHLHDADGISAAAGMHADSKNEDAIEFYVIVPLSSFYDDMPSPFEYTASPGSVKYNNVCNLHLTTSEDVALASVVATHTPIDGTLLALATSYTFQVR